MRLALPTTAILCFALSACGVSFGDGSEPECGPPPRGVHTVEEEPPLCQGATIGPRLTPSVAQINEVISVVERYATNRPVDVERVAVGTQNVCASLVGGAYVTDIAPAARDWFGTGTDSLSLADARAVAALIESQGWCAH